MSIEAARLLLGAMQSLAGADGETGTAELADRTRLKEPEVIEGLYDLEHRGLVTPTRWKLGPNPIPMLPIR